MVIEETIVPVLIVVTRLRAGRRDEHPEREQGENREPGGLAACRFAVENAGQCDLPS